MILKEYIKKLQELENKGFGDLPLIYSTDDEGNAYHEVSMGPEPLIANDLSTYYIELRLKEDEDTPPNCICIN